MKLNLSKDKQEKKTIKNTKYFQTLLLNISVQKQNSLFLIL
jgi:hypothetical protein